MYRRESEDIKEEASPREISVDTEIRQSVDGVLECGVAVTLCSVAGSRDPNANLLCGALPSLQCAYRSTHQQREFDVWLTKHFTLADVNKNSSFTINECKQLLKQMNKEIPKDTLREFFEGAKTKSDLAEGKKILDRDGVVRFLNALPRGNDVQDVFSKYSGTNGLMDCEGLLKFLTVEQNEDYSPEECIEFMESFGENRDGTQKTLDVLNFESFLLVHQDIFDRRHLKVCQDMTRPLNEYFIASSHNTYLLSHQLVGTSSVDGYVNALRRGCRCLELDVWDGSTEPVVFHGYTLVNKILLKDVLAAIKEHAFTDNEFPVILSIENHCTIEFQEMMARLIRSILGDSLCVDFVDEDLKELPSPLDLRNKVLIKGKKLDIFRDSLDGPDMVDSIGREEENSDSISDSSDIAEAAVSDQNNPPEAQVNGDSSLTRDGTLVWFRRRTIKGSQRTPPRKKNESLSQELSDVVNYLVATPFRCFKETETWKCYQMTSLSESKCSKFITDDEDVDDVLKFTRKNIARIYPKSLRTGSTNFNPIPFFNMGCQIVALNYQTPDKNMFYNMAMFAQNGGKGFVLKPAILREAFDFHNPPFKPKEYTIKIISGKHIPKPNESLEGEIVDPYVVLRVLGHPRDHQKFKTGFVSNNGFDPRWGKEFTFSVTVPDLAILVFLVKDDAKTGKNNTLGRYALPLETVRSGYRYVHLRSLSFNRIIPATLFVHIAIND